MGKLIPLAEYLTVRDTPSPWFGPFRACADCPSRTECREARYCQWGEDTYEPPAPELRLRVVDPPDIVA